MFSLKTEFVFIFNRFFTNDYCFKVLGGGGDFTV